MSGIKNLATDIFEKKENIILIYAFNGVGKTSLSVEYKNHTKIDDKHTGAYYNAYSEDLFTWDNDVTNSGTPIKLKIIHSSLNTYHSSITEEKVREKLDLYRPTFDFYFQLYEDPSKGIELVSFYPLSDTDNSSSIKISRGEQQVFIWCFFLALFDNNEEAKHFFIDDPVSSLDDHNIFVTVLTIMDLIEEALKKERKIIITTHHISFISTLSNWLTKGEKASRYKKCVYQGILKNTPKGTQLLDIKSEVFLYHLELIKLLKQAIKEDSLNIYHFAILRQILENISSFLGSGRMAYTLEQIGYNEKNEEAKIAQIINILAHNNVFKPIASIMVDDNKRLFKEILDRLTEKFQFIT